MVIVRKQIMLGDKLLKEGLITQSQLEAALVEQKRIKEKLGETLVRLGYITNDDILPILANHIGVGSFRISRNDLDEKMVGLLPEDFMRKNQVIPVRKENRNIRKA